MAIIIGLSGPALQGLAGAGTVDRSISDLSGVLGTARAYAMANHTYVRVGLAPVAASGANPMPQVAVVVIYSADGELDAASSSDMTNGAEWPMVRPPVFLENLVINDSLNGKTPATNQDAEPSQTDIGPLSESTPPALSGISFKDFVQFEPSGEARVVTSELARNIKIALDNFPQADKNPFILRLSGINGTIVVLRKEDM